MEDPPVEANAGMEDGEEKDNDAHLINLKQDLPAAGNTGKKQDVDDKDDKDDKVDDALLIDLKPDAACNVDDNNDDNDNYVDQDWMEEEHAELEEHEQEEVTETEVEANDDDDADEDHIDPFPTNESQATPPMFCSPLV
jgi:hypothetical protein